MNDLSAQSINVLKKQAKKSAINMEEAIKQLNDAQTRKEERVLAKEEADKAKKIAMEEVKRTQSKAVQVVKNAVVKQESASGGIIDMVTSTLAKHAQDQKDKSDMRTTLETEIMTRVAATDSKIKSSRSSLKAGLTASKDITPQRSA